MPKPKSLQANNCTDRRRYEAATSEGGGCEWVANGWRQVAPSQIIDVTRARANGLLWKRRHLVPPMGLILRAVGTIAAVGGLNDQTAEAPLALGTLFSGEAGI